MQTEELMLAAHVRELAKEMRERFIAAELKKDASSEEDAQARADAMRAGLPLHDFIPEALEELRGYAELIAVHINSDNTQV